MLRTIFRNVMLATLVIGVSAVGTQGQDIATVNEDERDRVDEVGIDRYLDVEIWTNHSDNEYYDGDNVIIYFRVNRDAFISIYTIDSRDRVNLLFPSRAGQDNYVRGGETYRLPSYEDDFDLVVSGPDGVENIQIIASREKFPIPDWYDASGLVNDAEDRNDFMDYVNGRYFVGYPGQKFSYDRTAIYINEWEPDYFRPVYYPYYPSWTVAGNVYIDYPYGGSIYIDGVYWGCAPLYIPRIYVGWHCFTVYDRWGHCWENDVHVTHYNTIILDRTIIEPTPKITSRYETVRLTGFKDPAKSGYADYTEKYNKAVRASSATVTTTRSKDSRETTETVVFAPSEKKFARGGAELTRTSRGFEPAGTDYGSSKSRSQSAAAVTRSKSNESGKTAESPSYEGSVSKRSSGSSYEGSGGDRAKPNTTTSTRTTDKDAGYERKTTTTDNSGSSDYYKKKSGTTYRQATPDGGNYQRKSTPSGTKGSVTTKTEQRPKSTSTSGNSGKTVKPASNPGNSSPNTGSSGNSGKPSTTKGGSVKPRSGGKG